MASGFSAFMSTYVKALQHVFLQSKIWYNLNLYLLYYTPAYLSIPVQYSVDAVLVDPPPDSRPVYFIVG